MTRLELEVNIYKLDEAVEQLVLINERLGGEVISDWVLCNIQHTIAFLEREIRDGPEEGSVEDDD